MSKVISINYTSITKLDGNRMSPQDTIRDQILRYFYNRNLHATSERGKKGSHVKISVVKQELKTQHQLSQQQVTSNLTYLVDKGWVSRISNQRTYAAPGGTAVPSEEVWYVVSASGIDRVEGDSIFKEGAGKFSGIRINASGGSIVTLGDGNIVKAEFQHLGQSLADFRRLVVESNLSESEKLSLAADVDALQGQLAKPNLDKGIVRALWDSIAKAADVAGVGQAAASIASLVGPLVA